MNNFQKSKAAQILSMYKETDLQKGGGEGSRGGKVIGHTKSGKPIYDSGNSDNKDFSSQDHNDAADQHTTSAGIALKLHYDASKSSENDGSKKLYNIAMDHYKHATDHKYLANVNKERYNNVKSVHDLHNHFQDKSNKQAFSNGAGPYLHDTHIENINGEDHCVFNVQEGSSAVKDIQKHFDDEGGSHFKIAKHPMGDFRRNTGTHPYTAKLKK